jgi:hypothetical protein
MQGNVPLVLQVTGYSTSTASDAWVTIHTSPVLTQMVRTIQVTADWSDHGTGTAYARLGIGLMRDSGSGFVEVESFDIFGVYKRDGTQTTKRISHLQHIVNKAVVGDKYILKQIVGSSGSLSISNLQVSLYPSDQEASRCYIKLYSPDANSNPTSSFARIESDTLILNKQKELSDQTIYLQGITRGGISALKPMTVGVKASCTYTFTSPTTYEGISKREFGASTGGEYFT